MNQIKQVVITGYDKEMNDKLLIVECDYQPEERIDVVCFVNYNIVVNRADLLDAIEFLVASQEAD